MNGTVNTGQYNILFTPRLLNETHFQRYKGHKRIKTTYIAHKKLVAQYQFLASMNGPINTGEYNISLTSHHIDDLSLCQTYRKSTHYRISLTSIHKDTKHTYNSRKQINQYAYCHACAHEPSGLSWLANRGRL